MKLCHENDDDFCYDGRTCPVCEAEDKVDELKEEIRELNRLLDGAKGVA